jgi:hypothetical protein
MGAETLLQRFIAGLFDHRREILHDLLLGVIDILELMNEEIVDGLNVFGKEAHFHAPWVIVARSIRDAIAT